MVRAPRWRWCTSCTLDHIYMKSQANKKCNSIRKGSIEKSKKKQNEFIQWTFSNCFRCRSHVGLWTSCCLRNALIWTWSLIKTQDWFQALKTIPIVCVKLPSEMAIASRSFPGSKSVRLMWFFIASQFHENDAGILKDSKRFQCIFWMQSSSRALSLLQLMAASQPINPGKECLKVGTATGGAGSDVEIRWLESP